MISLIFTGCHKKVTPVEYVLPDTVQLQSGDLAFRTGISKESRAVTTLDRNSIYTHVGMVVWTDDGWRVLHAVPNERASKQEEDSVKLEPIGTFFRSDRAEKGGIYRYPLTPKDTQQLREHALALYARHPLFDNLFDAQDTIAFYCTELVYFLYLQELQIDLSEGRRHNLPLYPDLIFCTDVSRNSKLQEVWSFH
ncbi:MAG: hypothetical protein J6P54_04680 [Bacteroidales bacterium]|nr:hypothetical protein [Bacteroidales bacterium]